MLNQITPGGSPPFKNITNLKIFDYIKASKFFPAYAPGVVDWKKKMTGKNGRGNPIDFSESDKKKIIKGLKKLLKDLTI